MKLLKSLVKNQYSPII